MQSLMELGVKQIGWTFVWLWLDVGPAIAQPATESARPLRSPNGRLSTSTVRRGETLSLHMAKAGGAAVILEPAVP
jgi:hypothetical protein